MNEDYIKRINAVLIFIDENLDSELSLEIVAKAAFYSPFHLHRVFKAITNETLNSYITRKRIEKTASILLPKKNVSISELSLQYGFNSNSSFTRTFKKFYSISPSEFRKTKSKYSKIGQVDSTNGQENGLLEEYICNINNLINWIKMNATIEIKEMPKLDLAFVTQIGVEGLGTAYAKLMQWAAPKGLLTEDSKMVTIYHDSFKITEPEKVRMSACLILKEKTEVSGEIGWTILEKGKCIVGHFEIGIQEFEKSWTGLFLWMNQNGYKKADRNPFEIYHNNFNEHPEKKAIVDFYIPIE
ncbi:GyrI-like domain-containing protein [Flavobacterium sp.]|jgi:AraC family transcriptional regulator|uniref:GyrI-like domain-containing protein n=1 Tax=Flavobacterium sp. TaxID=239 RepID=UPI0037BF54EA